MPDRYEMPATVPKLCAELHRCFPPRPSVCLLCHETDPARCPYPELQDRPREEPVMHLRRRLTDQECVCAKHSPGEKRLEVRDIRGSDEEAERLRRLLKDAPYLRPFVAALAGSHTTKEE